MSCDLDGINSEIKSVTMNIAEHEGKISEMRATIADMEQIKADCLAAKPAAGTGKGIGAGWAAQHSGTAPVIASHRSGATGQGTSNTGVFTGVGTGAQRPSEGGRRTRRSKSRKMRSRKMRR